MEGLPTWALLGFMAALLSAAQMLLQEFLKAPALPMAFWIKVGCILIMAPFVISVGFPTNGYYYFLLTAQSLLWVISDVIFYREVSNSSAGVISRIIPIGTIVSFFLWFAYDWTLASTYTAHPIRSVLIVFIFSLSAFFAWWLKECPVTWKALRAIWFVLLAAVIGMVSTKYITLQTDVKQGAVAYTFCEAVIMVVIWLVYYMVRHPLSAATMFGWPSIRAGLIASIIQAAMVTATVYSVYYVDNPAYVGAVKYTDAILILLFYRLIGHPHKGLIWPGLGVVACTAALVILKAQY